jgi:LmbE family N-acetylglucosaminyl deacetylase
MVWEAVFCEAFGMIPLTTGGISSIAVIGAHCDDIAIGAGATLMRIAHHNPDVVVHALVLTSAGTEREIEEKNALATLFPRVDVRLTVADLPQCRARYAEDFVGEKAVVSPYGVNSLN